MKKLLLLLALTFLSAQSFAASCPDGSEPVKSVSEDGTYFVYNCSNTSDKKTIETENLTQNDESTKHKFECMNQTFDKLINVFGVYVAGSNKAPMDKVMHTAGVLAQYLDNDEDGQPDDPKIVSYLSDHNYIVPVWSERDREKFWENAQGTACKDNIGMAASMYYDEDQWAIGGIKKTGQWDTNLEEVWHVVSAGWYEVYPEYFGNNGSKLHDAMNKARGGYFRNVPSKYPKNAWYSYNDESCRYECQAHEYFYWILMANINALDPSLTNKCNRSKDEWHICNKSELREQDVLAYELLNNNDFVLPTQIPDGEYMSKEIISINQSIGFSAVDYNTNLKELCQWHIAANWDGSKKQARKDMPKHNLI